MINLNFLLKISRKKRAKTALVIVATLLVLVFLMGDDLLTLIRNRNLKNQELEELTIKSQGNLGGVWLDMAALSASRERGAYSEQGIDIPEKIYPRGLNIVFVSDNFESFEEFKDSVRGMIESFKSFEPWKSHKEINFFSIFNSDNSICEVKDETGFAPVLKCDKRLIEMVQKLPLVKVKVAVVSRRNFVSWANVTRFENSFVFYNLPRDKEDDLFNRKIFLHEFAHGFGLKDETRSIIGIAGSAPTRPDGPNCAPDLNTANFLWGDFVRRTEEGAKIFDSTAGEVGFYFGCAGNQDYLRPTQQSLMNIQDFPGAEGYGPVSEAYLKKVLNYCFSSKIYSENDDPEFFAQYPEFKECL